VQPAILLFLHLKQIKGYINALELKQSILNKFPGTWRFIVALFTSLIGNGT
jgi:hypothetical protein